MAHFLLFYSVFVHILLAFWCKLYAYDIPSQRNYCGFKFQYHVKVFNELLGPSFLSDAA